MTIVLVIRFSRKKPNRFIKIRSHKLFNVDKVTQIIETLITKAEKLDKNIDIERRTKKHYLPTV